MFVIELIFEKKGKNGLNGYRSYVIYITRYLPGTNRANGLEVCLFLEIIVFYFQIFTFFSFNSSK